MVLKAETFEEKVRLALLRRNMTATQLAKEIGISNGYLHDLIKGNRDGKETREKIVKFLELK